MDGTHEDRYEFPYGANEASFEAASVQPLEKISIPKKRVAQNSWHTAAQRS